MSEVKTRLDRELDSREVTKRPAKWMPPQLLPDPKPEPGYAFRWIRVSSMGKDDATNISGKFREGWEPVKASEHQYKVASLAAWATWESLLILVRIRSNLDHKQHGRQ